MGSPGWRLRQFSQPPRRGPLPWFLPWFLPRLGLHCALVPEGSLIRRSGGSQTFKCEKGASPIHSPCYFPLDECMCIFHSTEGSGNGSRDRPEPCGLVGPGWRAGRGNCLSSRLSPWICVLGTSGGGGLVVVVWPQLAWPSRGPETLDTKASVSRPRPRRCGGRAASEPHIPGGQLEAAAGQSPPHLPRGRGSASCCSQDPSPGSTSWTHPWMLDSSAPPSQTRVLSTGSAAQQTDTRDSSRRTPAASAQAPATSTHSFPPGAHP